MERLPAVLMGVTAARRVPPWTLGDILFPPIAAYSQAPNELKTSWGIIPPSPFLDSVRNADQRPL